jgi:hypothetical protein
MKTMNTFYTWVKTFITPKEWVVLISSFLMSILIISSIFWVTPLQTSVVQYAILGTNIRIEDYLGKRLSPFYSIFYTGYEARTTSEERQLVESRLQYWVPRLHQYADRHHLFYQDRDDVSLGYVANLHILNQRLNDPEPLVIEEDFYHMLHEAQTLTVLTEGRFNMFIGHLSDFWDDLLSMPSYSIRYTDLDPAFNPLARLELETRLAYIPIDPTDVMNALVLEEINGQYTVRFPGFNQAPVGSLKITLGAFAKGFANDVIADDLMARNLTRGFIYNGSSSLTGIGPRYSNRPYEWQVESPIPGYEQAFTISIPGRHSLSTSGAYNGRRIRIGSQSVLRHHIINPLTGYPSQQAIELNVISKTYPAGGLDALSTAMMVMTEVDALNLRNKILAQGFDLEVSWIHVEGDRLIVRYTDGYHSLMKRASGVRYEKVLHPM